MIMQYQITINDRWYYDNTGSRYKFYNKKFWNLFSAQFQ